MALVRCPEHKIPYNDDNPRGCPACAREREGAGRVSVMQELAKAQRTEAPPPKTEPPPRPSSAKTRLEARGEPPTHPAYRRPRTTAVPAPDVHSDRRETRGLLTRFGLKQRFTSVATGLIIILLITWVLISGPQFREGTYPMPVTGATRPLSVNPNTNITAAFGALGTRSPKANPDSPRLARYTYGSDLSVDASNGIIYAITVRIPNRSWRGLHAGMPEQEANGALARLGTPEQSTTSDAAGPEEVAGYWVYPSLDARPRRMLQVEVRPPNGCYDVQVELQPRAIGTLEDGERRYAVVGTDGPSVNWVVTQVRIVSRSIRGPYSGVPAC